VQTRIDEMKLSAADKSARILSLTVSVFLTAAVFFLFFVLIAVALALFVGDWLGSRGLGFLIVAVISLLAAFWIWVMRERWIRRPIRNALLRVLFEEENKHE
jgi:O-antigen/teichoic acid export membrane protein